MVNRSTEMFAFIMLFALIWTFPSLTLCYKLTLLLKNTERQKYLVPSLRSPDLKKVIARFQIDVIILQEFWEIIIQS